MQGITIVILPAPGALMRMQQQAILDADAVFLQTEKHPSATAVHEIKSACQSMDDLFEAASDFDALNDAIRRPALRGGELRICCDRKHSKKPASGDS